MIWFITSLILALIGALVIIFGSKITVEKGMRNEHVVSIRKFAILPLGLALLFLLFSVTTIVQAKNVGVVTTFGKPVGTLDSGLHLKAPWQKVTEVDGTVIPNEYKGDSCIYARIGDGSRSCVSLTIRWQIVPSEADTIYANYRSDDPTEEFRKAVVSTQLKAATQQVLAEYNPVAELEVVEGSNAGAASELSFAPDYDQISKDILASMETRTGADLVNIEEISVSYVSLSKSTQKTIDGFIKAVGETRVAAQARNTAIEQARANEALSASVSNAPGVLQSRCLDLLSNAIDKDYELPAGFNCLGDGSAVIVPSAPAKGKG
jgi:regulator of protease activity HflC (stomatin/prohibitin superfamily)